MSHDRYRELYDELKALYDQMERRMSDMEALMQGELKNGIDGPGGVIGFLKGMATDIYGNKESGEKGIIQSVKRMERIIYVCIGIGGTIHVGWMLFIHFHK